MKTKNLLLAATAIAAFAMTVTAQTIPSYIPTNGLVGWWPFNGNANDESGNGNHGTVNGATLTMDRNGVAGKAYYFSGSGCTTFIQANVNTSSIQSGLTISIWLLRSGAGCFGPRILEFGNNPVHNDGPGVAQWGWDNNYSYGGFGSVTSTGQHVWSAFNARLNNVWTHLVYTNDGSFGRFYQDGVLINTVTSSGYPILASNVAFGRMNHPAYDALNGKLDDIGVWNRALSQQEITALYTGVPPCTPTSSITNLTIPSASLPYTWNGLTFNASGSQTKHLTNAAGCDSTATLILNVINTALPSYLPANGLVAWYPFNGNANDESGNNNNGVLNGPTLTSDRFGNVNRAYSFLGSDFITVPENNLLDLTDNFSISSWFNAFSFPGNSFGGPINLILCKRQNIPSAIIDGFGGYGVWESNGNHIVSTQSYPNSGAQNYPSSNFNIQDSVWYNYVITYDDITDTLKYYLNGTLIFNEYLPLEILNNSYDMFIGALGSTPTYFWNGKIDDIAIYNRALTQTEITALYQNTIKLNLTTFLEGSYADSSSMIATANKINAAIPSCIADSIIVELHASTSPYATMYSSKGVVNTNGTAAISFPNSTLDSSYYIVIKHRNSIETWSASPVTISNHTIYNFTTAASQAYGANLSNLGSGVFAMYSGDINQDGSIDFNDYPELDIASNLGVLGYDVNDLNGDASVDFNDFPILDVNSNNGIIAIRP
jgi:hypothetical protein